MYACMYACMYVSMYVSMYVCTYVSMYACAGCDKRFDESRGDVRLNVSAPDISKFADGAP